MFLGSELFYHRSLGKSHIVLVSRYYVVRIFLCSFLYECKERRRHLFSVDYERASEDFMATMLGINLCKTEHFAVSEFSSQLSFHFVKVFYFFGRESKSFALVIFLDVLDMLYRFRLAVGGEYILVKPFIHSLEHRIISGVLIFHGEIFFYAFHVRNIHVLGYFHRVGAPRSDHFATRTHKEAVKLPTLNALCVAKQPTQLVFVLFSQTVLNSGGYNVTARDLEKYYHIEMCIEYVYNMVQI